VARTAVGWIEGAQKTGVIANVKHFAANNQEGYGPDADLSRPGQPLGPAPTEGGRMTVSVEAAERTLREIYLPQFEAAVKEAHVGSVMCSYNKLRGTYACQNPYLLQRVLRKDWGFKGFTIADYGANHDTALALRNGLDFEPWPGRVYGPEAVTPLVLTGQVPQATVDEHVHRILRTLFAYGFFDRAAYRDDDGQIPKARHAKSAQTIEENAITLLRNQKRVLPLKAGRVRQIAVIGKVATQFVTGGGSGNVKPFAFSAPLDAIRARAGAKTKVVYDDGSDAARAAALARRSSVALVFAADYQTEGIDRRCLSLECPPWNGDQDALISSVAAANRRTVAVLETGGPVLTPWRNRVAGIVEAWYPGQSAGPALARMLFGDVDAAGRLPATFPKSEADEPVAGDRDRYPGVNNVQHYSEGVLVGYRWWDAKKKAPAYPFGAGRSYTRFRMSGLRTRKLRRGRLAVSIDVRNVGRRRGVAVPQLYVGIPKPRAGVTEPPRQLKAYRKIRLRRGAHRRVSFTLGPRSFAYWESRANRWKVARGCYRIMVGPTSRNISRSKRVGLRGGRCR
jgi:beta-glucosidase